MRARASGGAALVLSLLLAACTSPTVSPEVPLPASSLIARTGDGTLRIGTLFPSSGSIAFLGPAQAAGVALAVADINAAGGVDGVPVEIVAGDSGDASSGIIEASFADLVAGGVDVVIGPSTSVLTERVIPLAARERIAVISPAATFPWRTEADDAGVFFRTIAAYAHQGLALASVIAESGASRVALLYVDDDPGRALAATVSDAVPANGGSLVLSRKVDPGLTDFAPVAVELSAAAPDVVIVASNYNSVDSTKGLISAAISAGFGGAKLWLTTQNTGDYSQTFPAGTLAGVKGIIEGAEPDAALIARLHGIDPTLTSFRYSTEAYDATILAALAAIVAGDDSGASIIGSLANVSRGGARCATFSECVKSTQIQRDIDYDGLSGPVDFTADGDVSPAEYGVYSYDGENRFVLERVFIG